jgi:hypothetical protein
MLSVIAVAMAGITFVATRDDGDSEPIRAVAQPGQTKTAEPVPLEPRKKKPVQREIRRNTVLVEVYNNSSVQGLASRTARKAQGVGWDVVGSDNWVGTIPASTVYYPPRLERAARLLGKDLGIQRLRPAVEPMRFDRLTVILTAGYA